MRATQLALALISCSVAALAACSVTSSPSPTPPGPTSPGPAATSPVAPSPTTAPTTAPTTPPKVDPEDKGTDCTKLATTTDFWAQTARTLITEQPSAMCNFQGNVVLVVNLASYCGYTYQYAPLQSLYEKHKAAGFYVLGFPSKSFNQEMETGAEVSAFCTKEYNITFPMFAIADVVGPARQPVYKWIASQPGFGADVAWNFEKFLVSRKGKVVARYLTDVAPDSAEIGAAIVAELAKPK